MHRSLAKQLKRDMRRIQQEVEKDRLRDHFLRDRIIHDYIYDEMSVEKIAKRYNLSIAAVESITGKPNP